MYRSSGIVCAALVSATIVAGSSAASAESRLSILVAGEAYEGAPVFEVRMGDKVIGRGELAGAIDTVKDGLLFCSSEPDAYLERFDFDIDAKDFDVNAPVEVALVNDKFLEEKWGYDRNLFVRSIEVNGTVVRSGNLKLSDGTEPLDVHYQAGLLPVYHQNHMAVATPPKGGWPENANTLSSRLPAHPRVASGTGG